MSRLFSDHEKEGKVLSEYPDYIIYNDGRIYSRFVDREMKFRKNNGYLNITLVNVDKKGNRKKVTHRVHILVAKAYHTNLNKLPVVNHIDGNKTNNHKSNLEWVSCKKSIEHAYETGLIKPFCRPVLRCEKDGSIIERYKSIKEAAKAMDCHLSTIGHACSGTKGLYTAKGFLWKYETPLEKIKDKNGEEWKKIKGHPKYKISSLGRIYSEKTKRYLKFTVGVGTDKKDGYKQIKLDKIPYLVHILVANAFLGPSPLSLLHPVVDHIDNNPSNNKLDNLHWVEFGKNCWFAHNRDDSYHHKKVCQYSLDGEKMGEYRNAAEAARKVNIKYVNIFYACTGKYKTAGGYQWRYAENQRISDPRQGLSYEDEKPVIKLNKVGTKIAIIQYSSDGDEIKKWKSAAEASRELNIYCSNITNTCRGKYKTSGGYKWKYA